MDYSVDVETAAGNTRAAKLTIDSLSVGGLVERAVPVLVVPKGQLKTNLLGMSFLDRLESWEVRTDRLKLRAIRNRGPVGRCKPLTYKRQSIDQHLCRCTIAHALLGKMPAKGPRARHAVKCAKHMPGDRVQPHASRKLRLDIGRHRKQSLLHCRVW